MFPTAGSVIHRNEDGEVTGWDSTYYDESDYDPADDYDDRDGCCDDHGQDDDDQPDPDDDDNFDIDGWLEAAYESRYEPEYDF